MDPIKLMPAAAEEIVNDFDDPVVVRVADGRVAVARHFVVQLGDGRRDRMRVQVAAGRGVDEPDRVAVAEVDDLALFEVDRIGFPRRRHEPLVVLVLVVVARDLLLLRTDGVRLGMRVQQPAAVAHVLQGQLGPERRLERVLRKVVAVQVRLEERRHLRVARTGAVQDQEVDLERQGVDAEWNDD